LDLEVERAAKGMPRRDEGEAGATLLPVSETTAPDALQRAYEPEPEEEPELDPNKVFAKLKSMKGPENGDDE
ncbi:hypothetical protein J8J27_28980, partial [Mycobacterium tuberculosis]|nr:hypothetical protein [Mycobacterium tuberculosis]